ncbi:MAG: hypothetical protein ABWY68_03935 [Cryobacterium sp.]
MNSYISTPATGTLEPAGYVSTGRPAPLPTGYVSPATHRSAGSYVSTEWVRAA